MGVGLSGAPGTYSPIQSLAVGAGMPVQFALTEPPWGMMAGRTLKLALGVGDGPEVGVLVGVGDAPGVAVLVAVGDGPPVAGGVGVVSTTAKLLLTATRVAAPAMLNSRVSYV